jgi:hypothetical protein
VSEDLAVIDGDPADLAVGRVDRLGVLDEKAFTDWLLMQPEVDPVCVDGNEIVWTTGGIVAEMLRVTGTDGRLRGVEVGITSGEAVAYDADGSHLVGALIELADRVGADLWNLSGSERVP